MAEFTSRPERVTLRVFRILAVLVLLMAFFPPFNLGRVSAKISGNLTLLTSALSFDTVTTKLGTYMMENTARFALRAGDLRLTQLACAVILLGAVVTAAGACLSTGNRKMRRIGCWFPLAGGLMVIGGVLANRAAYSRMADFIRGLDYAEDHMKDAALQWPAFADTAWLAAGVVILAVSLAAAVFSWRGETAEKAEIPEKYRLFFMFLPVLALSFVFAYLPIYGWRYAFYNAKAGDELTSEIFVGFQNFVSLANNPGIRMDILKVLRNTLVMSGLGIATSWLPIAFAILLAEVRSSKFQRGVQTLTTIPNFLSWVLVYAVALSLFATDGLVNNMINLISGANVSNVNYLNNADHTWLKMLLWGTWKCLGWSAIIYVAGIAGIDQQLYEAAKVDGANRFQCIWHITVPGLMPTYMVMLLMSVAGILSNGMEQYLVFSNPYNGDVIQVLDLYVYNMGIGNNQLSISTVVGILKSVVGIVLLFGANGISKAIRGESII